MTQATTAKPSFAVPVMRAIALLGLVFGIAGLGLLDGQVFTHAVMGIIFGVVAVLCGWRAAVLDAPHRWEGRIMAGLGLILAIFCMIGLPSKYRFEQKFNARTQSIQNEKSKP